jgi:hypothetical protein
MEGLFSPGHLMALLLVSMVVIVLGTVAMSAFRKIREKELQYHQDMRTREMEYQTRMKQLEIDLARAKGRDAGDKIA